ncbi:mCG146015, partial [Mus musculus]
AKQNQNCTNLSCSQHVRTVRSGKRCLEQSTTLRKYDSPLDKTIGPDMSYQHNHPPQQRPGINTGILPIETLPHRTKANSTE